MAPAIEFYNLLWVLDVGVVVGSISDLDMVFVDRGSEQSGILVFLKYYMSLDVRS